MTVALIVAAGSGERLGAGRPKAYVELAGRAMVEWSVEALAATPGIDRIVVATPPGAITFGEIEGVVLGSVRGGASRSESVRAARWPRPARATRCSSTTQLGRC